MKRILPPTYFMFSLLLNVTVHFIFPIFIFIHFPWNLFGLLLISVGGIMNLVADRDFKRFETTVKPFEDSNVLITKGIFNISRNPMYLGMTIILLGESILLGSISPFIISFVFMLLMHTIFIKSEERMLAENFPVDFEGYMKKVRRWI